MKNETYEEFVAKFNKDLPKTTDDCYTPREVIESVQDFVHNHYGVPYENMVRPFYPGGDYEREEYGPDDVVVDNPPFSLSKKIQRFYCEHGIKFFLFCPGLLLTTVNWEGGVSYIAIKDSITYANGAKVATAFVTNLEPEQVAYRTDEIVIPSAKLKLKPKQETPLNCITAAKLRTYGGYYKLKDFWLFKKCFGNGLIRNGEEPRYETPEGDGTIIEKLELPCFSIIIKR